MRAGVRRVAAMAGQYAAGMALLSPSRLYATSPPSATAGNSSSRTPAQMEREVFKRAMETGDTPDAHTAAMASMSSADGFVEQHGRTPGHSEEDAFGHVDPLMAVEQSMHAAAKTDAPPCSSTAAAPGENAQSGTEGLAAEIDGIVSGRNRRRNRRKRSMDAILGDVLHDALMMRDMGEKPSADFVYKRTQERVYEEEYGAKPPSAKENAAKFIPFPPDFHMHRLLPLFGDAAMADASAAAVEETAATADSERPAKPAPVYTKNQMHVHALVGQDPWPERAVTPDNPVWTRRDVEADKEATGGKKLREWEERMYAPRPGYDIAGEFLDAMDELAHWELQLLTFLRVVPLSQRRSLPFLHEWYRLLVHRVVRAERRYLRIRDVLLPKSKASASVYARTEQVVVAVRSYYAETHRSLASPNYDPMRMKKSSLAPILRMTDAEFLEWQEVQRQRRNALVAELS